MYVANIQETATAAPSSPPCMLAQPHVVGSTDYDGHQRCVPFVPAPARWLTVYTNSSAQFLTLQYIFFPRSFSGGRGLGLELGLELRLGIEVKNMCYR